MIYPARLLACCLLIAGVVALAVPPARAAEDVSGLWLDQSKSAVIEIQPCGDSVCGSIVWLREPLDPKTGKPKIDLQNGDPGQHGRPICGLPLLWGFVADPATGEWKGGRVYDPESGDTYHAQLALDPDGTLRLRGYIGIPLIGRSEIWSRVAPDHPRCAAG